MVCVVYVVCMMCVCICAVCGVCKRIHALEHIQECHLSCVIGNRALVVRLKCRMNSDLIPGVAYCHFHWKQRLRGGGVLGRTSYHLTKLQVFNVALEDYFFIYHKLYQIPVFYLLQDDLMSIFNQHSWKTERDVGDMGQTPG